MKSSRCSHCEGAAYLARRDFLRVGALNFLGITLADFLRFGSTPAFAENATVMPRAKAQSVILIWLEGGASQVDTWDVKGNSTFHNISTNVPGIQICEVFPKIAKHMDKLSIIRSMKTDERNHPQSAIQVFTGHRPNPVLKSPSFGSIVSKELGGRYSMPPFVVVPTPFDGDTLNFEACYKAQFTGSEYDGMVLPDPSLPDFQLPNLSLPKTVSTDAIDDGKALLKIVDKQFRAKQELAEFSKMDSFEEQALRMLLSPNVHEAFDLSREPAKTRDAYGRDPVGQSALLARRLVEAGCRFVMASGWAFKKVSWDTHLDNDRTLRNDLAPLLDRSLSVLLEDLKQRGLLESTVVIVSGEFGRTAAINPNAGRDHWPDCWSLLVGGGGIAGGRVVGASDKGGAFVAERPVSIGDLYATVYKAMGIDWTKTYMSPIGRPLYIANGFGDTPGTPIKELI
jgi:Protein of unknown function (DUF1501)